MGKGKGSEDVETESAGITILRSLTQRVVAEIGELQKDTEHREFFFFFNMREADGRQEGEIERWEERDVSRCCPQGNREEGLVLSRKDLASFPGAGGKGERLDGRGGWRTGDAQRAPTGIPFSL